MGERQISFFPEEYFSDVRGGGGGIPYTRLAEAHKHSHIVSVDGLLRSPCSFSPNVPSRLQTTSKVVVGPSAGTRHFTGVPWNAVMQHTPRGWVSDGLPPGINTSPKIF